MGRGMLIICLGALITTGIISINTSKHGNILTEKTVNYADFTMAKNTAHSAIQIVMQEINDEEEFMVSYGKDNPWTITIDGRDVELYIEPINDVMGNSYWEADSMRIVSMATQNVNQGGKIVPITAEVASVFLKSRFSQLVPDFEGAMTFAADPDKYSFEGGGSASISGNSPSACGPGQEASKPGVTVMPGGEDNLGDLDNIDVDADPPYHVNPNLSYNPTDELIARLLNSSGATRLDGDWGEPLGTAEEPGVFFVDEHMRLNGKQKEGFGILVVKENAFMEYADSTDLDGDASLDMNGNFEWNGLIIFEDAYNFTGRGTPTINGSILVGHTEDYDGQDIKIDISGNIHFQYDCKGEDYAKMAAANAVEQDKYTRVVTTEVSNYLNNN
ncbi:MAG: hypothetical protein WD357_09490 [Gracilimonas sp.]